MANQIEVPKLVAFTAIGAGGDEEAVSKLVAYLVLVPGEIEPGDTTRQGNVYAQIIRRS